MIERKELAADSNPRIDDVIVLNADFRWQDNNLSILEIADGISCSGYTGYNRLYGRHSKDEVMFKGIFAKLASRFRVIYVIHHTTKGTDNQIPTDQLASNIKSFDTYFQFIDYIKSKRINLTDSLVVVGEDLGMEPLNFAPRTITEIKLFLNKQGITIPVVNSAEMFKFADDKIIFNIVCPGGVTNSFIVTPDTVLEKTKLFLSKSTSAYVVLKPPAECRGKDVRVVCRKELNRDSGILTPIFSHLLKTYGTCLLQDYIESDELTLAGLPYDPTGRAVLILYKSAAGNYEVELVDAYWKLPSCSKNRGISEASQISHISEDQPASSAELMDVDKTKLSVAFKAFFKSPQKMFLTSVDFLLNYYQSMQKDEQQYLRRSLEEKGIAIESLEMLAKIQSMEKRFYFYFDIMLIKSLIMMVNNDFIESTIRRDLVLYAHEIRSLLNYLTSEKCSNKLILPNKLLMMELNKLAYFSFVYPTIKKLVEKIGSNQKIVDRLVKKYKLADSSPKELGKGLRNAANSGNVDDLALFLDIVTDINQQDDTPRSKNTALHWAVLKKKYSCVQRLLDRGCQFTLKNASGQTVLEIIQDSGDAKLTQLLQQSQAASATQLVKSDQCAAIEKKIEDTKQLNTSSRSGSLFQVMPPIPSLLALESKSVKIASQKEQKHALFSVSPSPRSKATDKALYSTSKRTKRQMHERLLRLGIFRGNDESRKESYRHVSSDESRAKYRALVTKLVKRI